MNSFDPLTIPLKGQQLIEASAGTGKTYSIAQLYVRFILESGLDVENILVVTFTTSATEELRQRIRTRLSEALDALKKAGEGEITGADTMLVTLLSGVTDRSVSMRRLTGALARMDESAIFTIHSFCQRMLQDHAFESGLPFGLEFLESESDLRLEIVQDFWRQRFYQVSPQESTWATATFKDPSKLLQMLGPILAQVEITCVPEVTDQELADLRAECQTRFQNAKACWQDDSAAVQEILENDKGLTRNAKSYRADRVEVLLAGMTQLTAMRDFPWVLPESTELLAASLMADNVKKNKTPPVHPFFDLFDDFYQRLTELVRRTRIQVLRQALLFLATERKKRKDIRAQMYFDDLLTGLDRAISGTKGPELVRCIRERFKVALVDEFQDTDPLQYRIFHRLFGQGDEAGLFMIGDPKQSIYSFRGADVFAFIKAKHDSIAQSAAYTMSINYRSTPPMVEAVNRLFNRDNPFGLGEDIGFNPVTSGKQSSCEQLVVQGTSRKPLQAMLLPVDKLAGDTKDHLTKEQAGAAAARWTATQISNLLHLAGREEACIGDRPLTGGDLAVLVRTHREAGMIQRELAKYGIASVYYSQDSVFSTDEAQDFQHVLQALLDLSDMSTVTPALATPLFGKDGHELDRLVDDATAWDAMIARLEEYRLLWEKQGIAAMLQKLLGHQLVVQRLISLTNGERQLTNYQHLAELLQEAGDKQLGLDGLVQWLVEQRQNSDNASGSQQLRLESDENLVRIVTVHKAKGLEYPVVFLPFVWSSRVVRASEALFFHQPGDMEHVVDLGSGEDDNYLLAEQERLAEDLRLLYVAVTRARNTCYFCWGRINAMENSAMAWLLHRDDPASAPIFAELSEERIVEDITRLNAIEDVVALLPYEAGEQPGQLKKDEELTPLTIRPFNGIIDTGWTISSYSQLARTAVHVNRAEEVEYAEPVVGMAPAGQNVFTFPRGADAGTCLHSIFEELDFIDHTEADLQLLAHDHLRMNGLDENWSLLVCSWVTNILATRLDPDTELCLQDLQCRDRLVEMGFYFSVDHLDPASLNSALKDYGFSSIDMRTEQLSGLMRGYIDLVFRFQDKYYLADYKSNYLGPAASDYEPGKLQSAMGEHRYDLQYLIYSVALHRYLANRIRDYSYERDFGGVYYLFLRGMHPEFSVGNGVFTTLPEWELIERLDNCFGRGEGL